MGSCTEAQVSHNVKWLKGYGAKLYNKIVFSNMIAAKMAEINNWNLIDFVISKIFNLFSFKQQSASSP
jgi:hypothetical protein